MKLVRMKKNSCEVISEDIHKVPEKHCFYDHCQSQNMVFDAASSIQQCSNHLNHWPTGYLQTILQNTA